MAGFKKGSIEVLCILISTIVQACIDLDKVSEENRKHTTKIVKALAGICENYLRNDIDGKFKFLDEYLNGKE